LAGSNVVESARHHKPVDDHESVYHVNELLDWKRRQVAEGTGRELSEHQLGQIVQHLEQSLAALTEAKLTDRPVGVIHTGFSRISIPLAEGGDDHGLSCNGFVTVDGVRDGDRRNCRDAKAREAVSEYQG